MWGSPQNLVVFEGRRPKLALWTLRHPNLELDIFVVASFPPPFRSVGMPQGLGFRYLRV